LELMKGLPDGSVDAVITDPPYGKRAYATDRAIDWAAFLALLDSKPFARFGYPEDLVQWCVEFGKVPDEWVTWYPPNKPMGRSGPLCKTQECIAIFGAINKDAQLLRERTETGKRIARMMMASGHHYQHPTHGKEHDVWQDSAPGTMFNAHLRQHPNEKPVSLMKKLIELTSHSGATILDPFMGSGTTGVACIQTGRNFIGYEIDPTYFETAKRRLEEAEKQLRLPLEKAGDNGREAEPLPLFAEEATK